jgi:hypothetical protein
MKRFLGRQRSIPHLEIHEHAIVRHRCWYVAELLCENMLPGLLAIAEKFILSAI